MNIHSSAIIGTDVKLEEGVMVGPYSVITGNVRIGKGTVISSHVIIEGRTTIGKNNKIASGAVIGTPPQDLKYNGEDTEVIIGDNNTIREYVTINRGTMHRQKTVLGSNNLLMAYVHIAHDCLIGNEIVLANCVTLAGHVEVEDQAIIGGLTPIHQFTVVGKLSIIGGGSRVPKDITPFCKSAGNPLKIYGLNTIGLTRRSYTTEEIKYLKKAYKILFNSGLNTTQALKELHNDECFGSSHVKYIVEFIERSKRGICKN